MGKWPHGKHVWPWFKGVTDTILPPAAAAAYYSSAVTVLSGSSAARKTAIVLYQTSATKKNPKGIQSNNGRYAWKEVLVVGELTFARGPFSQLLAGPNLLPRLYSKPARKTPGDLFIQLAGYIHEIFYVQSNRRFIHAFTIAGDLLRTWIFHRGGGFESHTCSINLHPPMTWKASSMSFRGCA